MKKLFKNESLKSHGNGPLYAYRIGKIRLSIGGYGWRRKWYRITILRYHRIATHLQLGPACLTFLHR